MSILFIIIGVIISIISVYFTILNFSNSTFHKRNFLIFTIIMLPSLTLIAIFSTNYIRLMCTIMITTISLYYSMFDKDIYNSIFYTIVYELFAFIVEVILSIIIVSLTNYNLKDNYSLLMVIFTILNCLSLFLISKIKIIKKFVFNINKNTVNKKSIIIYVILILFLMILFMVLNFNNFTKAKSFYINFIMTIFVFITLIYIIKNNFQKDILENNYNEMMEYVQKYEKIINDQGKKNHEYNNQLMVIKGYSHNPKKLEEYLDLIINEHKCGQNYTIRELSYFPDGGIKGLIYHKISKMEENNIKYYLFVDKNIKNVFEDKLDLKTYQDITKLLGIFLDNAIEATMLSDKKEVEIDFKKQDDCIIMDISNTFNNKDDIKQIGKKGFTTKGFGHGYGLSIVKDINKHNNNIESFNDIEDDKFKQTTIIYYK